MISFSDWIRCFVRRLFRSGDTAEAWGFTPEHAARSEEPPLPALPPGLAQEDATLWHYFNDQGRKTGSNDYSEWHRLVRTIVTPDGEEFPVDLHLRDWQALRPWLWVRTRGWTTEVVVDKRTASYPVTIKVDDYHWTGDQDGGCDGTHSKVVEHWMEAP